MSPMERLGLAFCRLENLCWDVAAGEKPNGFDEADDRGKRKLADEPMRKIKAILGTQYHQPLPVGIQTCNKSEESWLEIQSRLYDKDLLQPDYGGDDFRNYTKAFFHHHFAVFFEKVLRFRR